MTAMLNRYAVMTPGRAETSLVNSYLDLAKAWANFIWDNNQWNFKGISKTPNHSFGGIWVSAKRVDPKTYLIQGDLS